MHSNEATHGGKYCVVYRQSNPFIINFMKRNNMSDVKELLDLYEKQLVSLLIFLIQNGDFLFSEFVNFDGTLFGAYFVFCMYVQADENC